MTSLQLPDQSIWAMPRSAPTGRSQPSAVGWKLWAVVAAGLALRLVQYSWNTAFHFDEAWLLENVLEMNFTRLAGPLQNNQAAPLFYLWLLKGISLVGSLSELAFRVPSLLASAGGLLLAVPLARRMLGGPAAVLAVALLAASDSMLLYTVRVKPYTIDALATTLLLLAALRLKDARPAVSILVLVAMEMVLIGLSYPSCFAYGGAMLLIAHKVLRSRRTSDWVALLGGNLVIAAAMFAIVHLAGSNQRSDVLTRYWDMRGFPMGWHLHEIARWPLDATYRFFYSAFRPVGAVLIPLAIIGGVSLWRSGRQFTLGLLTLPLLLAFLAALFHRYPWVGGRLSLYAVPILAILSAQGIAGLLALTRSGWLRRLCTLGTLALAGACFVYSVFQVGCVGHRQAHTRPLVCHMLANWRDGDCLAVVDFSKFMIYLRGQPVGQPLMLIPEDDFSVRLRARNWRRCWLLLDTDLEEYRPGVKQALEAFPLLEMRTEYKAKLYLLNNALGK